MSIETSLEKAKENFVAIAGVIQEASEPLTLEALCELSELAEEGRNSLEAAINLTIEKEGL